MVSSILAITINNEFIIENDEDGEYKNVQVGMLVEGPEKQEAILGFFIENDLEEDEISDVEEEE